MQPVATKKRSKCLHCERKAKWRGVCLACYMLGRRRMYLGQATDADLVRLNWWLPSRKGNRGPRADLIDAVLAGKK